MCTPYPHPRVRWCGSYKGAVVRFGRCGADAGAGAVQNKEQGAGAGAGAVSKRL